jgi:predicted metalloprotease
MRQALCAGVLIRRAGLLMLLLVLLGTGGAGATGSGPQSLLGQLNPGPPADPTKPPPSRPCPDPPCFDPSAGRTAPAFMHWVGNDVARFWRNRVRDVPYPWQPAREVIIKHGGSTRSNCVGLVTSSDGPFYCARDRPGKVFLPSDSIQALVLRSHSWRRWRKKDFAIAYIVAHEWGHHLQDVLGILRNSHLKSIQIELQADCLAGVWSHSTWARGLLEPGDIPEAIKLAPLAGDARGTPKNDPQAHGSPRQRAAWFMRGYRSGKAGQCIVPAP